MPVLITDSSRSLKRSISEWLSTSEDGLVVPVLHGRADKKSLSEIASELDVLTNKARQNGLSLADVSGGTFTLTNLGMFGIDLFTPIINPPEVAILGVGKVADRAVVRDDQIVVRKTMPLCSSFDHRVIDGATAAKFLTSVVARQEDPHSEVRI